MINRSAIRVRHHHWVPSMAAIAVAAFAIPGIASAQATDPVTAAAPKVDHGTDVSQQSTVPEIVVTGERRTGRQFNSTSTVSALTGNDLAQSGVANLDSLQNRVPALTVSNAGVANLVNIRGVGRSEVNAAVTAGVQIYRDGVPTFNGYFSGAEPYFDIASVEVYKGPQGTFAGQDSTGGAIFISSRNPSFDKVSGYVQGQIGNANHYGIEGAVGVPLSDTLAIRVAGVGEKRGSLFNYSGPYQGHPNELSLAAGRLTVLWKPSSKFQARLKADYDYIDQGSSNYQPNLSTMDLHNIASNAPLKDLNQFYRLSADLSYTFDNGAVLRSLSAYQKGHTTSWTDQDGTATGSNTLQYSANQEVIAQEINLVSPSKDRFRYILGLFYTRDALNIPSFFSASPPVLVDLVYLHRRATNYAAFAHFTFDVTPRLHAEVGGRYNRASLRQDALFNVYFGPFLLQSQALDDKLPEGGAFTGKISLSYDLSDTQFIYGFVATGRKNPGLNGSVAVPSFKGEHLTDFEAGYRQKLLDRRVVFQAAGYYYRYDNFQFNRQDPVTRVGAIGNVPGITNTYGFEAQLDGHFSDTKFNLSVAWAKSELPKFFADDPRNPAPAGCPAAGPSTGPLCVDLTGRGLPYMPEWTMAGGVEHTFHTSIGGFTPRVDVSHTSDQWGSLWRQPGDGLNARTLVNAQLQFVNGPWTATAYVTNAFNVRYAAALYSALRVPGLPQQYGLRLSRNF